MFKERVELGAESYTVQYSSDPYVSLGSALYPYQGKKIMMILDENVDSIFGHILMSHFNASCHSPIKFVFPAGEENKTLEQATRLVDFALQKNFNRDDVFLIIGGGVVGDMGAFAASLCLRGIPVIQVPTTLLAQVDSSIGGKTGVNHIKGKNLIGTFYQPKQVIVSPYFYRTLPEREMRTGFGEVIKYAMIKSQALFNQLNGWLNENPLSEAKNYPETFWESILGQCVHIKSTVVSEDEKESGLRMILNYGHTFGHAIETATQYSQYTHGEAIAIGMNMAALIARGMGLCEESLVLEQQALLRLAGLPVQADGLEINDLFNIIKVDKKVKNGKLTLVLPEKIGTVRIVPDIDEGEIYKILQEVMP